MNDNQIYIDNSMPPSSFVTNHRRYKSYCNVTLCVGCGLRSKYEDVHPSDPCPRCGSRVDEKVGRWIDTVPRKWYQFWIKRIGYWQLKGEE